MNFLVTIYVKRKSNIVVRHYVCKPKFWFGGLVTKWEGVSVMPHTQLMSNLVYLMLGGKLQ